MSLSDKIIKDYIAHPCLTTKDVKEFIDKDKQLVVNKIMSYVKANLITPVVANALIGEINKEREEEAGEKLT